MPLQILPLAWRNAVIAVLATESSRKISWTHDARRRYEASASVAKMRSGSPDPVWSHEIYWPMQEFLAGKSPRGCPVRMGETPGETYEFLFPFWRATFYGKILLFPDRQRVLLFSAHIADFPKLRCDDSP
jgi:hypothetical protein